MKIGIRTVDAPGAPWHRASYSYDAELDPTGEAARSELIQRWSRDMRWASRPLGTCACGGIERNLGVTAQCRCGRLRVTRQDLGGRW